MLDRIILTYAKYAAVIQSSQALNSPRENTFFDGGVAGDFGVMLDGIILTYAKYA